MYIPFAETQRSRKENIVLLLIVSTRRTDCVDENVSKLISKITTTNADFYNASPDTIKQILAVIPMADGPMVDTWSFVLDYYLGSERNYRFTTQLYGVHDVGYIKLLKTKSANENCISDNDCIIHDSVMNSDLGYREIVYWYRRALGDKLCLENSDSDNDNYTLEAPSLTMLTELMEQFMRHGWLPDIDNPEFACGSYNKSRLWNIRMIR